MPDANADISQPVIALRDLHKRFGQLEVIKGLSLEARQGEVLAILGSSGSGKSTMLRCINMLEMPSGGEVWIDGEAVRFRKTRNGLALADRHQMDRLRTRVAMVFQSFNLWSHMTILENLIEAPIHVQGRPAAQCIKEARRLLDKVGIGDKADAYPAHLSGGQQQRAAIARALAMNPDVMLFDEPTSALDPERVGEVLKVIRDLAAEGRTMLVVTHEMAFAREVATRVVFLHEGRIEEDGPAKEVFAAPKSERFRKFIATTRSE